MKTAEIMSIMNSIPQLEELVTKAVIQANIDSHENCRDIHIGLQYDKYNKKMKVVASETLIINNKIIADEKIRIPDEHIDIPITTVEKDPLSWLEFWLFAYDNYNNPEFVAGVLDMSVDEMLDNLTNYLIKNGELDESKKSEYQFDSNDLIDYVEADKELCKKMYDDFVDFLPGVIDPNWEIEEKILYWLSNHNDTDD